MFKKYFESIMENLIFISQDVMADYQDNFQNRENLLNDLRNKFKVKNANFI